MCEHPSIDNTTNCCTVCGESADNFEWTKPHSVHVLDPQTNICVLCGASGPALEASCTGKGRSLIARPSGGSSHYYELPEGATELRHLIRHKHMEHGIGEAFCSLYRLNDNGEKKRNLEKVIYYCKAELEYMETKDDIR